MLPQALNTLPGCLRGLVEAISGLSCSIHLSLSAAQKLKEEEMD